MTTKVFRARSDASKPAQSSKVTGMICVAVILVSLLGFLEAKSLPHASVILSRHCVRTPETAWYCMGNYTQDPQAYASKQWPVFPAPSMICTPRGLQIIQGQGAHYGPTLPTPIIFIADNMTRDIQTSQAYAAGIGIPLNMTVDGALFEPSDYGEANAATEAEMASNMPLTQELLNLIPKIQALMGQGTAPLLQDIPEVVQVAPVMTTQGGMLTGGQCGGSEAAEAFLMELGTFGMLAPGLIEEYLQLQVYDMWLENCGAIAQNEHSNLLWHVRSSLANYINGEGGTTFYVGHDSDLAGFGQLLNLSWQQPGYPFDTTNPGSALRFDLWPPQGNQGWTIELSHVGTEFYTTDGNLSVTPVKVAWSDSNYFSFDLFDSIVQSVVDWACVQTTDSF